jgi:hypothetical protein
LQARKEVKSMSEVGAQKKHLEKEKGKMKRELNSIPDPYDVDGGLRPEITANKLTFLLIKHSKRLNKLTWSLIGLTILLTLATILDILARLNIWA